jgi:alpha/beta superfamily hydrolase
MSLQLDKMIAIAMPGEEWALEGIYSGVAGAESGAVVAPPHPLYGGSMDSPVVAEIVWACQGAGHSCARFNWRGVGASGGTPSGEPAHADADYAAALAYLEECVPGAIVAAGYSFGAVAAVRAALASPRVRRLLLVAPPPALLEADALARFRGRTLVVVGSADEIAPAAALAERLGDDARRRLELIPGADHFFASGLADISRLARAWLGTS